MIDIRPLFPRDREPSEPLVTYNKAKRRVVVAAEMSREAGSYYDRYGYQGSQEIVCIDCKEEGRGKLGGRDLYGAFRAGSRRVSKRTTGGVPPHRVSRF